MAGVAGALALAVSSIANQIKEGLCKSRYSDRLSSCYTSAAEASRLGIHQGAASGLYSCSQAYSKISRSPSFLAFHLKYTGFPVIIKISEEISAQILKRGEQQKATLMSPRKEVIHVTL